MSVTQDLYINVRRRFDGARLRELVHEMDRLSHELKLEVDTMTQDTFEARLALLRAKSMEVQHHCILLADLLHVGNLEGR